MSVGKDESVLTIEAVDEAIEKLKLVPQIPTSDNPYVLPPRMRWCQYPLFQQAWFEADRRSGIGVLPEKIDIEEEQ